MAHTFDIIQTMPLFTHLKLEITLAIPHVASMLIQRVWRWLNNNLTFCIGPYILCGTALHYAGDAFR